MAEILAIRLTPRGGRDAVEGWALDPEGRPYLKVRVASPPVDGAANAALIAFLAKSLKIPRSAVRLASGETARIKRLEIDDVDQADFTRAFGPRP
ncbi:DUF167 domain-containing protein [Caulobacter segnis]|uniref:UPF0235 protein Cseg_4109 n=2 Tax=Caulobacter segnis TaxID=88688 RepID=D5VPU7_CAUST|nr:DUF167 domain-containing protein [Caulobacter segnis]ADG12520.1 protein of unknown function DUF167 [Caulobacter segnis ATCC 21756]AVQ04097.1 DUF167 domain-containing protein [Caulobacter segnis]